METTSDKLAEAMQQEREDIVICANGLAILSKTGENWHWETRELLWLPPDDDGGGGPAEPICVGPSDGGFTLRD